MREWCEKENERSNKYATYGSLLRDSLGFETHQIFISHLRQQSSRNTETLPSLLGRLFLTPNPSCQNNSVPLSHYYSRVRKPTMSLLSFSAASKVFRAGRPAAAAMKHSRFMSVINLDGEEAVEKFR